MVDRKAAAKSGSGWKSPVLNIVPTVGGQCGAGATLGTATSSPLTRSTNKGWIFDAVPVTLSFLSIFFFVHVTLLSLRLVL